MALLIAAYAAVIGGLTASSIAIALTGLRQRLPKQTVQEPASSSDEASALVDSRDLRSLEIPEARSSMCHFAVLRWVFAALLAAGALLTATALQPASLPWHVALGNPQQQVCTAPSAAQRLERYGDLSGFTHPIATVSAQAQALFDQGLLLSFNFNQYEARRAFSLATQLDPHAAMPQWGLAYALGPFLNRVPFAVRPEHAAFTPDDFQEAAAAAQRALQLARDAIAANPGSKLAMKELEVAEAGALKYAPGSELPPARDEAQQKYGEALAAAGREHRDAHLLAMAAEGLMNLFPWDYYQKDGSLKPLAAEAERLILEALALDPAHPLALHLHIHIAEAASPLREPPRGRLSAARVESSAEKMLLEAGPWRHGQGHLMHMPSHTFVRIGRYHDAVQANINAYFLDLEDSRHCQVPLSPEHNTDLLIYAANMAGEVAIAEEYSLKLQDFPDTLLAHHPGFAGDPTREWAHLPLTYAFHGVWDNILGSIAEPPPTARGLCPTGGYEYAKATYHFVRTLAFAAHAAAASGSAGDKSLGQPGLSNALSFALGELGLLKAAAKNVVEEVPTRPGAGVGIHGCDHRALVAINVGVATARIAMLQNNQSAAEAALVAAVAEEDAMGFMEPPRQYQPVRQCLGHAYLVWGQPELAQQVYEEDLALHPTTQWSLHGLIRSLELQGRLDRITAEGLREQLALSAAHADSPVESSCPSFAKVAA